MSKDEILIRLFMENIELRDEIKRLKENSIPIKKCYLIGDLAAVLKDVVKNNKEEQSNEIQPN